MISLHSSSNFHLPINILFPILFLHCVLPLVTPTPFSSSFFGFFVSWYFSCASYFSFHYYSLLFSLHLTFKALEWVYFLLLSFLFKIFFECCHLYFWLCTSLFSMFLVIPFPVFFNFCCLICLNLIFFGLNFSLIFLLSCSSSIFSSLFFSFCIAYRLLVMLFPDS